MPVRFRFVVLAAAVAAAGVSTAISMSAQAPKAYTAPRTPWGHPDLQGTYSNDDETGTPMERPAQFEGRRQEDLTPEEFAKLVKDRNDAFNGRRGHRVRRRAAAADASHLRQLRTQEQARVARGRSARRPDSAADRGSAAPAACARRREHQRQSGGPLQQLARHGPLRSLHHPRHPCVDDAGRLRQLLRHRAVARQRGDPLRDDPRDARGAVRSAPARVACRSGSISATREPGGRARPSWSRRETFPGRPRRSGAARRW